MLPENKRSCVANRDFVGVATPTPMLTYVGIDDRAAFDKINRPISDHGEKDARRLVTLFDFQPAAPRPFGRSWHRPAGVDVRFSQCF